MSRFPRWRRRIVFGAGAGTLGVAGVSARGHVWSTVDPSAPIEVRLEAVVRNVERLDERLIQVQNEMDSELRKHSDELRKEQQIRATDDEQIQLRLEAAQTGGLYITFIGVIWLFVGVLLSTISPEIARWVSNA